MKACVIPCVPVFSPADIFDGVGKEAENLVLLGVDFLALGVHPSPTRRTLHHAGLVVVVIISTLSQVKVWSLDALACFTFQNRLGIKGGRKTSLIILVFSYG